MCVTLDINNAMCFAVALPGAYIIEFSQTGV